MGTVAKPPSEDEILASKNISILEKKVITQNDQSAIWEEDPTQAQLLKTMYKVQLMCQDEQNLFAEDQKRLAPVLQKWHDLAQSSTTLAASRERPQIGKELPRPLLEYIEQTLKNFKELYSYQR
jgi:hypothetical protein